MNDALEYGLNTATEYDATGNNRVGSNFNFRLRGISGAQRSRNLFRTWIPGGQPLRASSGPATVPGINTSVNVLDADSDSV